MRRATPLGISGALYYTSPFALAANEIGLRPLTVCHIALVVLYSAAYCSILVDFL